MLPAVITMVAVLFLSGCSTSLRTGKPIHEEQVRAIAPGATTKDELFERFGPPAAIAARGEIPAIPTPSTSYEPVRGSSSYNIDANTFFELFPAARGSDDSDDYRRIYYYRHVVERRVTYFLLLGLYTSGGTATDRLWILMDEKTGTVEDYACKKSGEGVFFGIPRN
ncbi:MAG: hypothetical protein ACM3OG_08345 [Actinomycetota bacterium]